MTEDVQLGRVAAASLAGFAGWSGALVVVGILSSRLLGPAGKGVASIVLVVASAASALLVAGIDVWAGAEASRGGWTRRVQRIARDQLAFVAALAAAVAVVGLVAGGRWGDEIAIGAVATFGTAAMAVGMNVGAALRRARPTIAGYVLGGVVALLGTVALVVLDRPSIVLAVLVVAAGRATVGAVAGGRVAPTGAEPATGEWRAALRFGVPTGLGSALTQVIYRADAVLIAALLGARAAGLYAVASAVTEALWTLPDALQPTVVSHAGSDGGVETTARAVRVVSSVVLAGGLAAAALAPVLVPLVFGEPFRGAAPAVLPLGIGAAALAVWKLLVGDLGGRGDATTRLTSVAVGIVVMLGLGLAVIPDHGIVAAGFASAAGYVAAAAFAASRWSRYQGRPAALLGLRRGDIRWCLDVVRSRAPRQAISRVGP